MEVAVQSNRAVCPMEKLFDTPARQSRQNSILSLGTEAEYREGTISGASFECRNDDIAGPTTGEWSRGVAIAGHSTLEYFLFALFLNIN